MRIKAILVLFGFAFVLSFCNTKDCYHLPETFSSYEEAVKEVKHSNFIFEESINTSKSSWIRGAVYYSCDKKQGYLIIKTDSKEYIYQNVPIEIWKQFRKAGSFGSFYTKNIKGNYQLTNLAPE